MTVEFKPGDEVKWAVHKDSETAGRFEIGFKNLTHGEAQVLLLTLNRLQLYRATGVDVAEIEGNAK